MMMLSVIADDNVGYNQEGAGKYDKANVALIAKDGYGKDGKKLRSRRLRTRRSNILQHRRKN